MSEKLHWFKWANEDFCWYFSDIVETDENGSPTAISCHSALYGPCMLYLKKGKPIGVVQDYTNEPIINAD
jgi:hypothetical protein